MIPVIPLDFGVGQLSYGGGDVEGLDRRVPKLNIENGAIMSENIFLGSSVVEQFDLLLLSRIKYMYDF